MRDTKRTRVLERPPGPLAYNELKAQWEALIVPWARRSFRPAQHVPTRLSFIWSERTAHRDPDGVAAGGRKLILDGMVKAGVLPSDGFATLCGFEDFFDVHAGNVEGVTVWFTARGASESQPFFAHRLPDLNELLAARELGARRQLRRKLRGRLA